MLQAIAALIAVAAVGCEKSTPPDPAPAPEPAARPPDDMDERMRHCPLSVSPAKATWATSPSGVRWEVTSTTPAATEEIRKRSRHIVEFAAGRTEKGVHGGGKGGGTMRNCPVVTGGVVITVTDIDGGSRLDVAPSKAEDGDSLAEMTRTRAKAFAFEGVAVTQVGP